MDRSLVACILAGGVGTRLYPATRPDRPKQFLAFGGDGSLLSDTTDRVDFVDETYVLTREAFADDVSAHAPEAAVLCEPAPKDTGPALVYAAHRIREQVGECVVLVLPSDHRVTGPVEQTLRRGARVALETEGLITFGVEPTRPATGYGYVEPDGGDTDRQQAGDGYQPVYHFLEKPDEDTARGLIERGCYWNAGIFAWTPSALLREARRSPLSPLVEELEAGNPDEGFRAVEAVSVDRAIMEQTDLAYVVPAAFEWADLGSWDAIGREFDVGDEDGIATPSDEDGNVILGEGLTIDATGCVLAGDAHVSVVGVDDLVVAAYDDRVLVIPREDAERVREVVTALREEGLFCSD